MPQATPLCLLTCYRRIIVLETTGHQNNNTAHAAVSFANPFTTDLSISHVKSNISFHGIPLGTIDTPIAFSSKGNSTTESPALDVDLNLEPEVLLTVVRICAVEAGLGTQQLDTIAQLGGYQYLDVAGTRAEAGRGEEKRDNMFTYVVCQKVVDRCCSVPLLKWVRSSNLRRQGLHEACGRC